jgi:hypothetical protein
MAQAAGVRYRWEKPSPSAATDKNPRNPLDSVGYGCAFLDYNNDGNLDILLVGSKLALYRGDGRGHFTDVTAEMGMDRFAGRFMGCAVGDYDADGFDDIYISGYHTGLLLRNERGRRFRDVTREAGLPPQYFGNCCTFGSLDNRPYLDLCICNYVKIPEEAVYDRSHWPRMLSPLQYKPLATKLYHNVGGRHFVDVTEAWGMKTSSGRGFGAAFAPIDAERRMGLAVANDMGNSDLFIRDRAQHLKNIGVPSGIASPRSGNSAGGRMGLDWGDYDNDGQLDLFVTTFASEPKILLHNLGQDVFENVNDVLTPGRLWINLAWGCKWLDVDNSGWLDLMVTNGHIDSTGFLRGSLPYREPTLLLRNLHGTAFDDVSEDAGLDNLPPILGRGLAIGDYDNDGRVDALVVDSQGAPLLLHNESGPVGHWLSLRLTGVRSNRDGYGALVTVTAGRQTQTRLCHADGSFLSSSDRRVHVGLAQARVADTVVIRWPSGRTDTLHHVPADHVIAVREGERTWKIVGT